MLAPEMFLSDGPVVDLRQAEAGSGAAEMSEAVAPEAVLVERQAQAVG
jgi:hypothetical protein